MMAVTQQKSARADDAPRQNGNNQSIFLDNQVVNVGGQAQIPHQAAVQPGQNVPNQNQNPAQQGGAPGQHPAPAQTCLSWCSTHLGCRPTCFPPSQDCRDVRLLIMSRRQHQSIINVISSSLLPSSKLSAYAPKSTRLRLHAIGTHSITLSHILRSTQHLPSPAYPQTHLLHSHITLPPLCPFL